MKIEHTTDESFITDCITNPSVWDASSDDGCGDPDLFFLNPDHNTIWIKAGDYGVFMLHAHNHTMYECHTMLLPIARGKAVEIAKEALKWAFENTAAKRIVTIVPEFNVLALRLARKVGMKEYGINPESFQKNGILYSQIMLGISK